MFVFLKDVGIINSKADLSDKLYQHIENCCYNFKFKRDSDPSYNDISVRHAFYLSVLGFFDEIGGRGVGVPVELLSAFSNMCMDLSRRSNRKKWDKFRRILPAKQRPSG